VPYIILPLTGATIATVALDNDLRFSMWSIWTGGDAFGELLLGFYS